MKMFHATDFLSRNDLCADWPDKDREELLNELLDIMGRHAIQFFGFSNKFKESGHDRRKGKRAEIIDAIFAVTGIALHLGEPKISIVFASEKKLAFKE